MIVKPRQSQNGPCPLILNTFFAIADTMGEIAITINHFLYTDLCIGLKKVLKLQKREKDVSVMNSTKKAVTITCVTAL